MKLAFSLQITGNGYVSNIVILSSTDYFTSDEDIFIFKVQKNLKNQCKTAPIEVPFDRELLKKF